jgi:hypothetical protein
VNYKHFILKRNKQRYMNTILYLIPYLKLLVANPHVSNPNIFFLSHISGLTLNTVCEPRERSNTQLLN